MRRKHRNNEHAFEPIERLVRANAHAPHLAERAGQRTALPARASAQLERDAPPLAMVGLCQVDELKVKGKSARQQDRPFRSKLVHHLQRACGIPRRLFVSSARLGIAPADCILPKRFHFAKQRFASLLAQHLAQQHAERANIAPEGRLFQVAGLRLQLRQALLPVFRIP